MGKLTCGVGYATVLQISDVEDWLDEHCDGDFEVNLADLDTGSYGVKKKIEVLFELPEDRDKFKTLFKQFEAQRKQENARHAEAEARRESAAASPKARDGHLGMLRPDKKKGGFF